MRVLPACSGALLVLLGACQNGESDADSASVDSAAAAPTSASVEDSIASLEQTWADATRMRDSVTLERLVAADFVLAGEDTTERSVPRAVWMMNTMQRLRIDSIRLSRPDVSVRGDTAIAALQYFSAGHFMETPPFRDSSRVTDTWVRGNDGWRVHRRTVAN